MSEPAPAPAKEPPKPPVPTDPPGEMRCPTCRFGISLSLLVGGKPRDAAKGKGAK